MKSRVIEYRYELGRPLDLLRSQEGSELVFIQCVDYLHGNQT